MEKWINPTKKKRKKNPKRKIESPISSGITSAECSHTVKMDTPNWIRYFVLFGLILLNHSICKFENVFFFRSILPSKCSFRLARIHHRTEVIFLGSGARHKSFTILSKWNLVTCCIHTHTHEPQPLAMENGMEECGRKTTIGNSNLTPNGRSSLVVRSFSINNW